MVRIEYAQDRAAGDYVERLRVANGSKTPVVFNKAQDGGCVVQAVIDAIALGIRRNEKEYAGCERKT